MELERLRHLLERVGAGTVAVDDALLELRDLPYEDLGYAKVDHHRALRKGFPEVVFCQNKPIDQLIGIVDKLLARSSTLLATRATREQFEALHARFPSVEFVESARAIVVRPARRPAPLGNVLVISAGTADMPVAEEAVITAEMSGCAVERLYDVGVAGIHRLLDQREKMDAAHVLIVVAGMEGALPSVVAGLVSKPVIAVPTSVGYGAHFGGVAPLLTMLNSCASGMTVVNIDNGFGAGFAAATMLSLRAK